MEEEMDLAVDEAITDFEPKYLGQLQLELTALETEGSDFTWHYDQEIGVIKLR